MDFYRSTHETFSLLNPEPTVRYGISEVWACRELNSTLRGDVRDRADENDASVHVTHLRDR
jgi:hypothetical protein